MKLFLIFFALQIPFTLMVNGQEKKMMLDESKKLGSATKSEIFSAECQGTVNTPGTDLKWRPILTNKTISLRPKVPNKEFIDQLKAEKLKLKQIKSGEDTVETKSTLATTPVVGTNYMANNSNGSSPLDNSMAISNGGWIVSVANKTIEYDDMSGNTVYYNDLVSFINDTAITSVCDPVVIYDVSADRFIFFCQTSPITSDSKILLFFSKTNNPNNGWWYYKLTGNPLDFFEGFDYPKLAVSTNELYVTGNLFYEPIGLFDEAILYQINKSNGYAGATLHWQYWHDISGSPFTLLPVSYGQNGSYGPGCYLVATDHSGDSEIQLYDLTDDMSGNPSLNYYTVSTPSYSPASNSLQLGTTCLLDNGDCRALSGFYLNGIIHFVFHSDIGDGWNGINYNRLTVSTQTNESSTFGLSGTYDYSYPSVVSYATSTTDKSVMINFGRTSSNIYPQVRVVNCDNSMNWSGSTLVKAGLSYVSYTGDPERWGDYTGASRKHNSTGPSVWISGSYGTATHRWNAWNAEIHDNTIVGIPENKQATKMNVFPNPIVETFNLEFTLNEAGSLSINIFDMHGKIVKELFSGNALKGINHFSFNKANLSDGTYFIAVKANSTMIKNEKIIIAD